MNDSTHPPPNSDAGALENAHETSTTAAAPTMEVSETLQPMFDVAYERQRELSLSNASIVALAMLIAHMLIMAVFTSAAFRNFGTSGNIALGYVLGFLGQLLIGMEFGGVVFLLHTVFLFPLHYPIRQVASFGTLICLAVQIAVFTELNGLVFMFPYWVGLMGVGWVLQRITGASLSFQSEPIYQQPLSIKVILAIAPLLLLIGFVPAVTAIFMGSKGEAFGATLIYYSMGITVACIIPTLACYGWMALVRAQSRGKVMAATLACAGAVTLAGLELPFSPSRVPWFTLGVISGVVSFVLGIALAYLPFHHFGFRPVWAKRLVMADTTPDISFDDIDRDLEDVYG
jgi:hypothetical protein